MKKIILFVLFILLAGCNQVQEDSVQSNTEGLESIFSTREFISIIEAARYGKFKVDVLDVSYEEYFKRKGDGSILDPNDKIGYTYKVDLRITYMNGWSVYSIKILPMKYFFGNLNFNKIKRADD